jgi:hypothetical protein
MLGNFDLLDLLPQRGAISTQCVSIFVTMRIVEFAQFGEEEREMNLVPYLY